MEILQQRSCHIVHKEKVRKQLKMLENKGLIEEKSGKFYPVPLPADITVKLFDSKRSRVGKKGGYYRLRQVIYRKKLLLVQQIPSSLKHYIERTLHTASKLVQKGKLEMALDLLIHILLPIRENGVLWLWKGDEFIHFERKIMNEGAFHCVKFPALAEILKRMGFQEGIMVWHILGHKEARELIHKIFDEGHLSWAWTRSIFHKLKQIGLAEEGSRYIIEIKYKNMMLLVYLRDIYNNLIKEYMEPWFNEIIYLHHYHLGRRKRSIW